MSIKITKVENQIKYFFRINAMGYRLSIKAEANPYGKQIYRVLSKLIINLQYSSVIPLLGIYPQYRKTVIQKDLCTLVFIAALRTIAKNWNQARCQSTIDE